MRNRQTTRISEALESAEVLLRRTDESKPSKWRSLCCVAAFGGILTATGCASAPTTPDDDPNYGVRTTQAATTYAIAGLTVSALLGGNSSQNLRAAGGAAIVGGLVAIFDNRDSRRLRRELEEYGVELYTITDDRNYIRTGAIHAHIPTTYKVGEGTQKNMQFFRALYDSAAYLPVMLEKHDRHAVEDITMIYTMPSNDGMFQSCDTQRMVQALQEGKVWLNGHLKELNSELRINNVGLRTSPTGQTDRERLYTNVLRARDNGPSRSLPEAPIAQCNEAEVAVVITYKS